MSADDVRELVECNEEQLQPEQDDLNALRRAHLGGLFFGQLNSEERTKLGGFAESRSSVPQLIDKRDRDTDKRMAVSAERDRVRLISIQVVEVKAVVINVSRNLGVLGQEGVVHDPL